MPHFYEDDDYDYDDDRCDCSECRNGCYPEYAEGETIRTCAECGTLNIILDTDSEKFMCRHLALEILKVNPKRELLPPVTVLATAL